MQQVRSATGDGTGILTMKCHDVTERLVKAVINKHRTHKTKQFKRSVRCSYCIKRCYRSSYHYKCVIRRLHYIICVPSGPPKNTNQPSHENTNSVDSVLSIDPDQHKHAAQAYCGFSVSGIITLYLYRPWDGICRPGQGDLGRYITHSH